MVVNFQGVQILVDFMKFSYRLSFTYHIAGKFGEWTLFEYLAKESLVN